MLDGTFHQPFGVFCSIIPCSLDTLVPMLNIIFVNLFTVSNTIVTSIRQYSFPVPHVILVAVLNTLLTMGHIISMITIPLPFFL